MIVSPISLRIKIRALKAELKYYHDKHDWYAETRGEDSKMAVLYRQAIVVTEQEIQSLIERRRHDYPQLASEAD